MSTDRIEKTILLRASLNKVWNALADSKAFGTWFGVRFDDPFEPGKPVHGVLVGTACDEDVAKMQKQHEGIAFDITIERMDVLKLFSFRWHPFAIEPGIDYSAEPTTLVTFELEETPDGVMVRVTESGFDRIPLERRAKAFTANEAGWALMVQVFGKYVSS